MHMRSALLYLFRTCLGATVLLGLSSCTVDEHGRFVLPSPATVSKKPEPVSPYHSPHQHIQVNEALLDSLNPSNSRIELDLGEQRLRVYRRDGGGKDVLAIETQISTGKRGHTTPSGNFRILEKSLSKRSNLYGEWVDSATGGVLINDGQSWKPPKGKKARFRGAVMPYWLRLTPGGVGIHEGFVPDHPASHGCIRVPQKVQHLIYSKVRVGTPVKVVP